MCCHYPQHIAIFFRSVVHAESDIVSPATLGIDVDFNPRSPCGERRLYVRPSAVDFLFQSTFSMRRTTEKLTFKYVPIAISIHVLHAENDQCSHGWLPVIPHFNPRSPCGERHRRIRINKRRNLFQSTFSMRRTTAKPYKILPVVFHYIMHFA